MVNKSILKAALIAATKEGKDVVIRELFNHFHLDYDYNNQKAGHIIDMLMTGKAVTAANINIEEVKKCYKNITDGVGKTFKVKDIDNIDCYINFEVTDENVDGKIDVFRLSFLDCPEILNIS